MSTPGHGLSLQFLYPWMKDQGARGIPSDLGLPSGTPRLAVEEHSPRGRSGDSGSCEGSGESQMLSLGRDCPAQRGSV